jgi:hypothetical protein
VVNNVFLSLVTVQRGIHNFVLYNQSSDQFKQQYDHYVGVVQEILNAAALPKARDADQEMSEGTG